ncbi:DUF4345 domain-containing protein [Actinoallomurus sp. CA-150999]|uniref:DUF4345 domain-containing protein n=1 Tax=Actinoallomurus sp. CA-150999 TaxID=3239887 RepID=UPI003D8B9100
MSITRQVIDALPPRMLGYRPYEPHGVKREDGMDEVIIGVVAVLFGGMGIYGLIAPTALLAPFGTLVRSADGRNEVRAVYGGFGVAVALTLVLALLDDGLRAGLVLGVALALAGMAGGRIISFAVERPAGFFPTVFYLLVEAVLAAALATAR